MKQRKLVIGLLVMLAVAVSGFTFAFWASSVTGNNDTATGTVTIGEGNEVSTSVVVADEAGGATALLVPVGHAVDTNEVEYVILQFEVDWNSTGEDANGTVGTLSFVQSNVLIDSLATYNSLVNLTYQVGGTVTGGTLNGDGSTDIIADGSTVIVYVKVTLTEPDNQTEYDAVATKNITFTGTFTVNPNA
jgi:hypothetical protein